MLKNIADIIPKELLLTGVAYGALSYFVAAPELFIHCRKIRQNQIAPYCFDLGDNPLEGRRMEPDPKVDLSRRAAP